ncbi:Listeria/Bacterioides repeat-containing protein [Acetitomaculum ruminis DSM 5522]|uniref:Listeria/Bacterioides repeat-containing protein n=1 Tax=Acetitomaculum ruminis DSM 5522 TaxID=1120918 RepID=A0A1I0Z1G6_9FIRM|nr:InlB B-repeat-containing protein [Acetitomaculum ruminis]SFB18460.1 Listeria/Bacterioides repeat-containing protein [Acetitomaculum ruminis DSM 5522]
MKKRVVAFIFSVFLAVGSINVDLQAAPLGESKKVSQTEKTEETKEDISEKSNDDDFSPRKNGSYRDNLKIQSIHGNDDDNSLIQEDGTCFKATVLPEKYISPDSVVPVAKNQKSFGTCWAFSGILLAEVDTLIQNTNNAGIGNENGIYTKDNIDFSELLLAYSIYTKGHEDELKLLAGDYCIAGNGGWDEILNNGSNAISLSLFLSSWRGIYDESKAPVSYEKMLQYYDEDWTLDNVKEDFSNFDTNDVELHMQNSNWLNYDDKNEIKQEILKNGAVSARIVVDWDDDSNGHYRYINENTHSFYTPNYLDGTGHEITIIGWDDNYDISNFSTQPDISGAWIVRNSWGVNGVLADSEGNFYLSYEDANLSSEHIISNYFEKTDNYDYNYQYDGGISQACCYGENGEVMAANVYTIMGDSEAETIEACSFATEGVNQDYEISIYGELKEPQNPVSGALLSTTKGHESYAGIHTIPLDKPVTLKKGSQFAVVVKLTVGYKNYNEASILYDCDTNYGYCDSHNEVEENQSFIFTDGKWEDIALSEYTSSGSARIKAFTKKTKPLSVSDKDISAQDVKAVIKGIDYVNDNTKPTADDIYIIDISSGEKLAEGVDYKIGAVFYNGDKTQGTLTIEGIGKYKGSRQETFNSIGNKIIFNCGNKLKLTYGDSPYKIEAKSYTHGKENEDADIKFEIVQDNYSAISLDENNTVEVKQTGFAKIEAKDKFGNSANLEIIIQPKDISKGMIKASMPAVAYYPDIYYVKFPFEKYVTLYDEELNTEISEEEFYVDMDSLKMDYEKKKGSLEVTGLYNYKGKIKVEYDLIKGYTSLKMPVKSKNLERGKKYTIKLSTKKNAGIFSDIYWESTNKKIAEVKRTKDTMSAVVLAKAPGTVIIRAMTRDGSDLNAEFKLTVPYRVNYYLNGGKNNSKNISSFVALKKKTKLYSPDKNGYKFLGWYTTKDFKASSKINFIPKKCSKDLNLYAKWEKNYKITYKLQGGKNSTKNPVTYNKGTKIILKNPSKAGYCFEGWYSTKSFKKYSKVTFISKKSAKDIILYAKWKKISLSTTKIKYATKYLNSVDIVRFNEKDADGYEILYSYSAGFESKFVNYVGNTCYYSMADIYNGNPVYLRIRSYKTDSRNKKIFGAYSQIVSVA